MRLGALSLAGVLLTAACSSFSSFSLPPEPTASEYWRPISEPNLFLSSSKLQKKLEFDLSQCNCGIYPSNAAHDDTVLFQADNQRLAQTAVATTGPDNEGACVTKPQRVVTECMRQRGWAPTDCALRRRDVGQTPCSAAK
ncbi:MAG: hypothetical protein PHS57_00355 [Alphaproteobacteria bacterium]|nr:hypothetical protein [Alphaproteobacteria bacterium]